MGKVRKEELAEGITLYQGDCRDVIPTLSEMDVLITDPPYGVDFQGKSRVKSKVHDPYISGDNVLGPIVIPDALKLCKRGLVFSGNKQAFQYPPPAAIGSVFCPSGAGFGPWGFISNSLILYYGKATPYARTTADSFRWYTGHQEKIDHPCPKPKEWMRWCVVRASLAGEIIFDPFMGSGTTGVAAVEAGRGFVGIELEQKYFDISVQRIADVMKTRIILHDDLKIKDRYVQLFPALSRKRVKKS